MIKQIGTMESIQWNTGQQYKARNWGYMQQLGCVSRASCLVKKASIKGYMVHGFTDVEFSK